MAPKNKVSAYARLTHPIRRWRIGKNLTVEEAIKRSKTNVTREAWRQWETGESPSDLRLAMLAKLIGVKPEELADELERWNSEHASKGTHVVERRNIAHA